MGCAVALDAAQQPPRQIGRDRRPAIDHLKHGLSEVAEPRVLDQVAGCTQLERVNGVFFVFHGGHHHGLGHRANRLHVFDHLKTGAVAQVQVDQHDFKRVLRHQAFAVAQ